MRVSGREAFTDETLRMTPSLRSAIGRANTCDGRIVPSRFKLVTACQAAIGTSKKRASGVVVARGSFPPAPLTRKSIFPRSPSTRRQASSSAGRSSTSAASARCLPGDDFAGRSGEGGDHLLGARHVPPQQHDIGAATGQRPGHLGPQDAGPSGENGRPTGEVVPHGQRAPARVIEICWIIERAAPRRQVARKAER